LYVGVGKENASGWIREGVWFRPEKVRGQPAARLETLRLAPAIALMFLAIIGALGK
jgi:hypothetical protein